MQNLSSMSGWDIARELGCYYIGDSNPIRHGGVFYSIQDWEHGYANCVEFWEDPEDQNITHIALGVINRVGGEELDYAFQCIGIEDDNDKNNIHVQIEACRTFSGIEPDDLRENSGQKSYNIEETDEDVIWEDVRVYIEDLSHIYNEGERLMYYEAIDVSGKGYKWRIYEYTGKEEIILHRSAEYYDTYEDAINACALFMEQNDIDAELA